MSGTSPANKEGPSAEILAVAGATQGSARAKPLTAIRSTQRDVRRHNRSLVLNQLYFGDPMSRLELTRLTGLSTAAMTGLVGELTDEGVLVEAGLAQSHGGRPRQLMRLVDEHKFVVGVDIGESRVRAGLYDLRINCIDFIGADLAPGEILPSKVMDTVIELVREVVARNGVAWDQILGIGVGMLGIVEHGDSLDAVAHVPTVGWDSVPVGQMLSSLAAPVFVDNGARTIGQAEIWFGAGVGAESIAVLLLGNGVGAAWLTHGGGTESARSIEWGHTVLEFDGRLCRCGAKGCIEAYVGAETLIAECQPLAPEVLHAGQNPEEALALVTELAETNDKVHDVLVRAGVRLGRSLGGLINSFRPQRILLGGYGGGLWGKAVLEEIRRMAELSSLPPLGRDVEIEVCQFGKYGVMTGAAILPLSSWLKMGAPADLRHRIGD